MTRTRKEASVMKDKTVLKFEHQSHKTTEIQEPVYLDISNVFIIFDARLPNVVVEWLTLLLQVPG
jgi:hypothetical protein